MLGLDVRDGEIVLDPAIPDEIVERTREKYLEAYERITGDPFGAWLRRTEA